MTNDYLKSFEQSNYFFNFALFEIYFQLINSSLVIGD